MPASVSLHHYPGPLQPLNVNPYCTVCMCPQCKWRNSFGALIALAELNWWDVFWILHGSILIGLGIVKLGLVWLLQSKILVLWQPDNPNLKTLSFVIKSKWYRQKINNVTNILQCIFHMSTSEPGERRMRSPRLCLSAHVHTHSRNVENGEGATREALSLKVSLLPTL